MSSICTYSGRARLTDWRWHHHADLTELTLDFSDDTSITFDVQDVETLTEAMHMRPKPVTA